MPKRTSTGWPWGQMVMLGWWALMFLGTHVPMPPSPGESPIPDKLVHCVMFAVLGALVPLWSGWTQPLTYRHLVQWFIGLASYAAVDELLQIPVGRTAEWGDWGCDLAGALTGLMIAAALQSATRPLTRRPPSKAQTTEPPRRGDPQAVRAKD